jgi:rod shape-determining protein MreC
MRFLNDRPLLVTIAITLVLLVAMFAFGSGGRTTGAENLLGTATSGVQSVFSGIANGVGKFFRNIFSPSDLEQENIALKEQVAQLQQQAQTMQELLAENERLKSLLSYVENNTSYAYITARVITKDPGYYFDTFVINAGYNDGVSVNDAVITGQGLVGRVVETGGTYSKVMSIIDSRSSVSGTVERTRDNGVVNGTAQSESSGGLSEMIFLPLEAELLPGDRVISNGLGGIFPSGFFIGTVMEVSNTGTASTGKTVRIDPAVDFLHLEEVMIVKKTATGNATP